MTNKKFNGIKVFSATMQRDRDTLGDTVTRWMRSNPELEIADVVVNQSSDQAFHCISIAVFYLDPAALPDAKQLGNGKRTTARVQP